WDKRSEFEKADAWEALSVREKEVLRLAKNGRTNQQIAEDLDLKYPTVVHHFDSMRGKLDVRNRSQAIFAYNERLPDDRVLSDYFEIFDNLIYKDHVNGDGSLQYYRELHAMFWKGQFDRVLREVRAGLYFIRRR